MSKALISPSAMLSRIRFQTAADPVSTTAASVKACSMASACVTTSIRWRSRRSTNTPAKGVSRKLLIRPEKATTPSSQAELVRLYTSQLMATCCIHVPISDMPCPMKNSR